MVIELVSLVAGGLAFLVASNGAIHVALDRRHRAVREELSDARVLLELRGVRAAVGSRAPLSASMTWFAGDLLITDRAVVLFPVTRGLVAMKQPPFVILKEGTENSVARRWGVHHAVAQGEPVRGRSLLGRPRVSLGARGKLRSRWTLHVETEDQEDVLAAMQKFLATEEPGGAYRERGAGKASATEAPPPTAAKSTPVAKPRFSEGFLHWDPETGFRQSPFTERIGHREGVVCFESDAADDALWQEASADLRALAELPLGQCYRGAGTYDVEPFLAADPGAGPLTGAGVLRALRARNFRSDYILDLDQTAIPYPGYVGYSLNDEVHTDVEGQHLFYRPGTDEEHDEELAADPRAREDAMETLEVLGALEGLTTGPLWFVLLHEDGGTACPLVVLFAVGRSRRGEHLIGVASQQVCHNLCD